LNSLTKHWAKGVGLIDGSRGLLTAYSLSCMVISYLQSKKILPVLQSKKMKGTEWITV
jgi:DNA polymerase sigma